MRTMSNALAIHAVTLALRQRLDRGLNAEVPGTRVTTCPPDRARDVTGNQVNLFLYHTVPSPAWRNAAPSGVPGFGAGQPPLALNLYYLVSSHGQNEDDPDPISHRLLGKAMAILHENPMLEPAEIRDALAVDVDAGERIARQFDGVRIAPQPLELDQLTRLWTCLGAPFRISVAYEVSVVLI
jgi:hypothetical protein